VPCPPDPRPSDPIGVGSTRTAADSRGGQRSSACPTSGRRPALAEERLSATVGESGSRPAPRSRLLTASGQQPDVILSTMNPEVQADDGCHLWTVELGHGDPLVFCHGGPGLWDTFEDLAALFTASFRTIRWDQRGCGRSQRRGPYSVGRSIRDLDAVRHQLAGPRTVLLGHSWGAHLALRYAIEHPDRVSHLIYVSGTGIDPGRAWHGHYERNLRRRLGDRLGRWEALGHRTRSEDEDRELATLQWSADFADPGTALEQAERMATPWLGVNYECNAAINAEVKQYLNATDMAAQCRVLAMPVLIVDGSEDIRPRWAVDSLHRALPDAHRVNLAGAGHLPWVEEPDGFRRAVADFLA
jgi:proline iminopeptidase